MSDLYLNSEGYKQKLNWYAKMSDDSTTNKEEINFKDLDKSKLRSLIIADTNNNIIVTQYYSIGQIPFYRTRTIMKEGVGVIDRIHILGWLSSKDFDIRHVVYVYESDNRIEIGDFNMTNHPFSAYITFSNQDLVSVV